MSKIKTVEEVLKFLEEGNKIVSHPRICEKVKTDTIIWVEDTNDEGLIMIRINTKLFEEIEKQQYSKEHTVNCFLSKGKNRIANKGKQNEKSCPEYIISSEPKSDYVAPSRSYSDAELEEMDMRYNQYDDYNNDDYY